MEYRVDGKTVYRYEMPAIGSNMYIFVSDGEALVIDPHSSQEAMTLLRLHFVQKAVLLLTHEHYDHISGVNWFRENLKTEVVCSAECARMISDPDRNMARYWNVLLMDKTPETQNIGMDWYDPCYACEADRTYERETEFLWQGLHVHMRRAPGHSKGGSLIWLDENILFSGDNLVNGTGVICRFPGGSKREYAAVTRPILEELPDKLCVFPGHGEPGELGEMRRYMEFFSAADRENRRAAKNSEGGEDNNTGNLLCRGTRKRSR